MKTVFIALLFLFSACATTIHVRETQTLNTIQYNQNTGATLLTYETDDNEIVKEFRLYGRFQFSVIRDSEGIMFVKEPNTERREISREELETLIERVNSLLLNKQNETRHNNYKETIP